MTKVLILTGDPIGQKMAGPAIRSWNIASELAKKHSVKLVTTSSLRDAPKSSFEILQVRPGENKIFKDLERWSEVIIFQGHALDQFEDLRSTDRVVVADIYDPINVEMLEQGREQPPATWQLMVQNANRVLNDQLSRADFLLCSSERQRLFYLGELASLGRLNPATYDTDPHFEKLIAIAPFGIDPEPPVHKYNALRAVVPGISKSDKVLIWGGGIYSWFDPISLIHAVTNLAKRRTNVRLYFLGTKHPGVEKMGIIRQSLELARELGVLDKSVFFNEDWVKFEDRQNYLTEADAAVSTHFSHLETTLSFRTRVLDYLWAGLPMVLTDGDSFAELVERESIGLAIPPGDVAALEQALERVLFDNDFRETAKKNLKRITPSFTWAETLKPLVEFVDAPYHAADFAEYRQRQSAIRKRHRKPYGLMHDIRMGLHYLRNSGFKFTLQKIVRRSRGAR